MFEKLKKVSLILKSRTLILKAYMVPYVPSIIHEDFRCGMRYKSPLLYVLMSG